MYINYPERPSHGTALSKYLRNPVCVYLMGTTASRETMLLSSTNVIVVFRSVRFLKYS